MSPAKSMEMELEHPAGRDLRQWVAETTAKYGASQVVWCDGSAAERQRLLDEAVASGLLIPLAKRPGSYLHRSDPRDVARVEERTVICTPSRDEAGPTNKWADPLAMKHRLELLLMHGRQDGVAAWSGRTVYVVPYLMGPPGSPRTMVGVELTGSPYVVLSMGVMARMGTIALHELARTGRYSRGIHAMLDLDPEQRWIAHFPHSDTVVSTSSNYGGNVLLGKKCLALRLGSWHARHEGWLAEHMLLLKLTSPENEVTFVAGAFPSACGKTNLAMLVPPAHFSGWKVETIGDDIAWLWVDGDGRLRAMNPENGYFGVAPGTNSKSNPNAVATVAKDTIFTNVALTPDGDVWWEGADGPVPAQCLDWQGQPWTPGSNRLAAHPNSRFCAPLVNNPALGVEAFDAAGVPISAILFGSRRATTFPLVMQAFNWQHGVYLGAMLGSETTAAATGRVGDVRRDPMAMLPFCGYHLGDYLAHWLSIGRRLRHPPRIFQVNWFRKDADGGWLWPGFGDNLRVLEWIAARCHGHGEGDETALGWMPSTNALDLGGLSAETAAKVERAQAVRPEEWQAELRLQQELLDRLGDRCPREIALERDLLRSRLGLEDRSGEVAG
jgi:phosphoenolpyruvate carboxykinase (GTP)